MVKSIWEMAVDCIWFSEIEIPVSTCSSWILIITNYTIHGLVTWVQEQAEAWLVDCVEEHASTETVHGPLQEA